MSKRKLYTGQPSTSETTVYTSTNAYTSIFAATVTGVTANAETLTVWLVPSGGSATDANMIYDGLSVAANTGVGLQLLINQTLNSGDTIRMQASTGSALTVHLSGDVAST